MDSDRCARLLADDVGEVEQPKEYSYLDKDQSETNGRVPAVP